MRNARSFESGATRTSLDAETRRGRDGSNAVQIRTRGLGPQGSFNLGRRGELARGDTVRPEQISFGVLSKSQAAKSSTMKGAKALAG